MLRVNDTEPQKRPFSAVPPFVTKVSILFRGALVALMAYPGSGTFSTTPVPHTTGPSPGGGELTGNYCGEAVMAAVIRSVAVVVVGHEVSSMREECRLLLGGGWG